MSSNVYDRAYDQWMRFTKDHNPSVLMDLLAEDVVFHSPVVFKPQHGKQLTLLYLTAAARVLNGFDYTLEIKESNHWALRFEGTIGEIKVIGFDIVTLNEEGKIVNFEVAVRPAKAIIAIQKAMAAMFEKLNMHKS